MLKASDSQRTASQLEMSSQAMMAFPGLLRPVLCVIPSTLLIPLWRASGMLPIGIPMILISFLATAASVGSSD
jgi:hypothetical protein